jgi:hypothetical protein
MLKGPFSLHHLFTLAIVLLAGAATEPMEAQEIRGAPGRQATVEILPEGVRYDPAIPTPLDVLGHHIGERITPPEEIVRYFRVLADAAPDRTYLEEYARSWEGRPLVMLAIGSGERMARREQIQQGLARLAGPGDLSREEEARLVRELPVVTALVHSIHGNEISPAASSMATAYHLLAAMGDPDVDKIMAESIVLIDPIQNPDGRARFVATNLLGQAAEPDPDPAAAERDEPWPGGRTNHYLFDLNRDWFALTQPESRGRNRTLLAWNPQVVPDLHEMGGNSHFYFPPSAPPGNPHVTPGQRELFEIFGRENANLFDEMGWPYFVREIFDSFYPGYGASWPTTQGALGKTFEQGSSRGLVFQRSDGSLLTYAQTILHNFHAALRTALTAAEHRERLLQNFVDFRRSAIAEGERGTRAYVLVPDRDAALALRLARTLAANGVQVHRADEPFSAGGRRFPSGSYIVPLDQGAGRLVRNILDPETPMDPAFVELQRERRAQRLPDQIYDITAWNFPHLWNVEAVALQVPVEVPSTAVTMAEGEARGGAPEESSGTWRSPIPVRGAALGDDPLPADLPPARVGWVIPWGSAAAGLAAQALDAGIPLHAAGASFTLEGRTFGPGTLYVRAGEASPEDRRTLAGLARSWEAEVVPVRSAFVEDGISLGSNQMRPLPDGRVLLVWDTPTQSQSAGWARWVLERRYGKRVTAVRAGSLGRADLSRFQVMVLPSGNYASVFTGELLDRMTRWVRDGGTLITLAEATRWATREDVGFLATQAELRAGSGSPRQAQTPDPDSQPIDLLEAIAPPREAPEPVSGAILRGVLDTSHVLAAGAGSELGVMVSGSRVFTPLTLDRGANVGVYGPLDRLVMSGIVWEEARPQLASKAFLMRQPVGRGKVIAFAEDPNFRGYTEGTQLLFMNAVLLGPAF